MTREELKTLKRAKARAINGQFARFEFHGVKYSIHKHHYGNSFIIRSQNVHGRAFISNTAEPEDVAAVIGEYVAQEVLSQ